MNIKISINKGDLDREWVRNSILTSRWGNWIERWQLDYAIENSLCFGAYHRATPEGKYSQIGFARVVSDRAVFSSITDVFVDEVWRGKGVGRMMMERIVVHPWIAPTICILDTSDADGFYSKFGFERRRNVMQRNPDVR